MFWCFSHVFLSVNSVLYRRRNVGFYYRISDTKNLYGFHYVEYVVMWSCIQVVLQVENKSVKIFLKSNFWYLQVKF